MIVLLHPRSVRRVANRRFPLSILSLAAILEGREEYEIVDANMDPEPLRTLEQLAQRSAIEMLAVSVMPGPQMVAAIELSKAFRAQWPNVPIVWGGYFPSLYPNATLNCGYVDIAVRGQGEDTFLELIAALREKRDLKAVQGVSYKDAFGLTVHAPDRGIKSPGEFPRIPYHRLPRAQEYIHPTFLGKRTAVHQASYGCPHRCKFCGVPEVAHGRQKVEAPERTAAILAHLQREFAIDSVQFYDNNFFLQESHAVALAQAIEPLHLKWWCEGRADAVLRYSDDTLRLLKRAGCTMIFFGAESGSDEALREMQKQLSSDDVLRLAERIRPFRIVPEFSFVIGNPRDPDSDLRNSIAFIRRIKKLNPESEIIIQHYTPTPHPDGMYGEIDQDLAFPASPEEWASPRWYNFTTRKDPALPWLPRATKLRVDWFELVMECRWPTAQDITTSRAARRLLQWLSAWRYAAGIYHWPLELQFALGLMRPRKPKLDSL